MEQSLLISITFAITFIITTAIIMINRYIEYRKKTKREFNQICDTIKHPKNIYNYQQYLRYKENREMFKHILKSTNKYYKLIRNDDSFEFMRKDDLL